MAARRITVESATRNDWRSLVPGRVPVLLAIALGLFIAAAIALTYNLARLKESFVWVEHTNAVIRNISAFERALLQAESGERGYLLTGDSSYLDSYTRAQGEIPGLLDSLKQLVSDNPTQTQRLNELRPNIEARLAEFKEAIELGPARLSEALAILMTARSRQLTPQIGEQLGRLRRTELSLLEERQHSAERTTLLVTFFASAMGILGLLSAAFGSFHLERQRTISQLRAANEDLTKSQEALRNREAHLQAILATVPDAMVVIDNEGLIQSFGAVAQRLFGYGEQEVQGKNPTPRSQVLPLREVDPTLACASPNWGTFLR